MGDVEVIGPQLDSVNAEQICARIERFYSLRWTSQFGFLSGSEKDRLVVVDEVAAAVVKDPKGLNLLRRLEAQFSSKPITLAYFATCTDLPTLPGVVNFTFNPIFEGPELLQKRARLRFDAVATFLGSLRRQNLRTVVAVAVLMVGILPACSNFVAAAMTNKLPEWLGITALGASLLFVLFTLPRWSSR